MPSILLIRHAQGSFGSEDYDVLSERGHAQVAALVDGLRARGVRADRIVCGSLRRQRETAEPCAAELGRSLAVDERWNEYHDRDILTHHGRVPVGVGVGLERHSGDQPLSPREFQEILNAALRGWIAAGDDGPCDEPWPLFRSRALGALHDLAGDLGRGEVALAVSSGGVIGAVTAALMGLPDDALIAFNHVSINTAMTKLTVGRGGITVVSVNEHAHLERPADSLVTYR